MPGLKAEAIPVGAFKRAKVTTIPRGDLIIECDIEGCDWRTSRPLAPSTWGDRRDAYALSAARAHRLAHRRGIILPRTTGDGPWLG